MTITSTLLDDAIVNAESYEKTALGIKYGPDFAQFATALMESKKFKDLTVAIGLAGMLSLLGRNKEADNTGEKLIDELQSNPITRDTLAMAFYVGYKLGQRDQELTRLEGLAQMERVKP